MTYLEWSRISGDVLSTMIYGALTSDLPVLRSDAVCDRDSNDLNCLTMKYDIMLLIGLYKPSSFDN